MIELPISIEEFASVKACDAGITHERFVWV